MIAPHVGVCCRGKYARLFALTRTSIINIDPDTWSVTNTWPYATDLVDFNPNVASPDEFTVTVKDGKKNKYVTPHSDGSFTHL